MYSMAHKQLELELIVWYNCAVRLHYDIAYTPLTWAQAGWMYNKKVSRLSVYLTIGTMYNKLS